MESLVFKEWLISANGKNRKQAGDIVSRVKRIERSIEVNDKTKFDIDSEYNRDKCDHLLRALSHRGNNEEMKKYKKVSLPVGSINMLALSSALRKYILFRQTTKVNRKL